MQKYSLSVSIFILTLLLAGCGQRKQEAEEDPDALFYRDTIHHDTIRLGDSLTLFYETRPSPDNAAFKIEDKSGRKRMMGGFCSECYLAQVIRYEYDAKGTLTGFSIGSLPVDPSDNTSLARLAPFVAGQDTFLYDRYNDEPEVIGITERYFFKQDDKGRLVGITDPQTGNRLMAPPAHFLTCEIKPCAEFWNSDVSGGYYNLLFYLHPTEEAKDSLCTATYLRYHLCTSTTVCGNRTTTLVYDREGKIASRRILTDLGTKQTYQQTDQGEDQTRKIEWENNRIVSDRLESRWGTVLEKTTYRYDKEKVQRKTLAYNYTSKALELKQDTVIAPRDVSNLTPAKRMDTQEEIELLYEW